MLNFLFCEESGSIGSFLRPLISRNPLLVSSRTSPVIERTREAVRWLHLHGTLDVVLNCFCRRKTRGKGPTYPHLRFMFDENQFGLQPPTYQVNCRLHLKIGKCTFNRHNNNKSKSKTFISFGELSGTRPSQKSSQKNRLQFAAPDKPEAQDRSSAALFIGGRVMRRGASDADHPGFLGIVIVSPGCTVCFVWWKDPRCTFASAAALARITVVAVQRCICYQEHATVGYLERVWERGENWWLLWWLILLFSAINATILINWSANLIKACTVF